MAVEPRWPGGKMPHTVYFPPELERGMRARARAEGIYFSDLAARYCAAGFAADEANGGRTQPPTQTGSTSAA